MFVDEDVPIPLEGIRLGARLSMPTRNSGVVVFARGGHGGRHDPADRHVAQVLQREHLGTVLLDLFPEEERPPGTADRLPDVPVSAGRLAAVVDWLADQATTGGRPIGLFGAGAWAAAAFVAAAERPAAVRAVVSCDGRPDLVRDVLTRVLAPTLLVVGERDESGAETDRQTVRRLGSSSRVEVVPGVDHLVEEPGALDQVARLAAWWFHRHVGSAPVAPLTS
ncbi:hypothetical protein [Saccharothrix longispora]|uniref:hypothetical protein n=1 Tax=Saccharothrix longispora TaxID=33920 RepID=UPI0028FDA917|nr:hypothetical protein [Saccharothrix longispora]MBY8850871.1 hypothetical protein [Saccharothrix sp. MB29]MDU0287782.1 hypothetical protein [Saccharothrix longispora]